MCIIDIDEKSMNQGLGSLSNMFGITLPVISRVTQNWGKNTLLSDTIQIGEKKNIGFISFCI